MTAIYMKNDYQLKEEIFSLNLLDILFLVNCYIAFLKLLLLYFFNKY